jgi:two-component system, chemotaxis family, CheB/CheR fusion protein
MEGGAQATGSPFPIVGVGASAGGLEAFSQLLHALPVDTGMGFVLVQHLSPTRPSLLAEILSRTTAMPVEEVRDEPRVEPNHVYVIPPDRDMIVAAGKLHLLPRHDARGQHLPIDYFLRSLAADQKHQAIGVILSGTATDGTLGLEEIKAEGGITFAQDDTAQQSSMPRSAIASGCVDFVLPPDEIGREVGRIARHPYVAQAAPAGRKTPKADLDFIRILATVRRVTGIDFTQYKISTLYRRITRRTVLLKMEGLREYARFLAKNPGEAEALYRDILINVTSFFRNPEMFEQLKAEVFPRLFKDRSRHEPVRIWVVGCSTGEEAYSLAIACAEFAEAGGSRAPVQIFATDLNGTGIDKARAGVYSQAITQDVSPERLRRFFAEVGGSYRITRTIRDMCVFARHNVLADAPFSQMDLISCRNLLIYLEPALQHKILLLLHYALKPAGRLLLGSSETIGSHGDLFEVEDGGHKVYLKKPARLQVALGQAAALYQGRAAPGRGEAGRSRQAVGGADVQKEADRILMARYAPPGVLVNAELEILQFRGDTGPYLAPAPGKASLNLLKMVREGLLVTLRAAISRAKKEEAPVREEGLRVKSAGGTRKVDLEVIPVKGGAGEEGGFLVLFEESGLSRQASPGQGGGGGAPRPRARAAAGKEAAEQESGRLKQELAATREYLQSLIEQQETANEELQSANEEVQSANEELQSINEELETSKEEVLSSNEELVTVNDELQNRNAQLELLAADLTNLLGSVQMAIVILGQDLRLRRFTPMAEKIFDLVPGDVDRPIGDIKLKLGIPDLEPLLAEVIATASDREREVRDAQGRWYSLRIRPYKTLENRIEGAVILLVDVDRLKRAREYAESIVATVREPLLVLDGSLRIQTASRSFYHFFQVTPEETEGRPFYELGNGQWDTPELRRLLEETLPRDHHFDDYEVNYEFEHIGWKTVALNARRLLQGSGVSALTLLAIEDVTARKQLDEALRQRLADLDAADRNKNEFLALLGHELRNPLAPLFNAVEVLDTPGAGSAAVERAREMMSRQIQNMARMVDDLLDVSRITQGKIRLRTQPVELETLLAGIVEAARHQLESRGQELSLALPREPVVLCVDRTRMEQIFGNLLNNASKFTLKGGRISVTAELASGGPQSAGEVVVRVRDDGIGIDPETMPRVFDLFMQADRSLDRSRGGLGIGLTLVRRLVEMHGGAVEAHSPGVGQGSEFVVRLPVRAELQGAMEAGLVDGLERLPVLAASRRVLVVDDNVDTAESLALLLQLKGHEVAVAHDGQGALDVAAAFHPEAVLLDIGLPGLDGYQVASRLRQHHPTSTALIVALTGYGQEEDQRRAQEAGFDQHLIKPVAPQAIYDLLARPRAAAGEQRPAASPAVEWHRAGGEGALG